MDSKYSSKFYYIPSSSIAKRVLFRAFFLFSAISIVTLIRFLPTIDITSLSPKTYDDDVCIQQQYSPSENATLAPGSYLFQSRILNTFWASFDSLICKKKLGFFSTVVTNLMDQKLLHCEARCLCLGQDSHLALSAMHQLGFSNVHNHNNKTMHSLHYQDSSFDFVLSKDLDKVSASEVLVLEVERILKPGGLGALLLLGDHTTVSSFLRSSTVVHVDDELFNEIENENSLVVFKKSENKSSFFYHYGLPQDCKSVNFNKPFINLMEPLVEERERSLFEHEKRVSYLPKFADISRSRKKLVYVNIVNKGGVSSNWFPPSYPIDQKDFSVYFVHYNTASILLSHVKQPRVTFVYHPGLAAGMVVAEKKDLDHPFVGEEESEFDFLAWFKETVQNADFVVLKMNAGKAEMKFLKDIYENGDICFVDELFLSCTESENETVSVMSSRDRERCMDIYKGLRSNGIYVHQWWDTNQGSHLSRLSHARL